MSPTTQPEPKEFFGRTAQNIQFVPGPVDFDWNVCLWADYFLDIVQPEKPPTSLIATGRAAEPQLVQLVEKGKRRFVTPAQAAAAAATAASKSKGRPRLLTKAEEARAEEMEARIAAREDLAKIRGVAAPMKRVRKPARRPCVSKIVATAVKAVTPTSKNTAADINAAVVALKAKAKAVAKTKAKAVAKTKAKAVVAVKAKGKGKVDN